MPQILPNSAAVRTSFGSANLTVNCSLAHAIKHPGRYLLLIWKQDRCVATVAVEASKEHTAKQATLDLFAVEHRARGQPAGTPVELWRVKEGGYLLLQVSQGEAEYRATLSDPSRPCELWDSRNLVAGDLYSVLVLVPGLYSVTNELSGTQARMHVQYGGAFGSDRSGAAVIAPVYVTCREKGFDPPQWQVTGVQPVVLAAEAAANFAIYLQQRTQDDKSKEQRLAEEREHLLRALAERKKRRRQKA